MLREEFINLNTDQLNELIIIGVNIWIKNKENNTEDLNYKKDLYDIINNGEINLINE